ncbi:MAG: stage II sporulation protein M [Dehalococcoidales bacterium]|nr:stage II sporulation protein M [Dehalococcoidales bacterium]
MSYGRWLVLAAVLFGLGFASGLSTPVDIVDFLGDDLAGLEEFAGLLGEMSQPAVLVFIFLKNLLALVVSFVFSPFFVLVPLMALVLNGGILGLVSALVLQEESLGYLLSGVLPHGIFELPAFFMAEAASLSFGTAAALAVFSPERRKLLLPNLRQNVRYLAIAVALLVPAALIETYITPLLLD